MNPVEVSTPMNPFAPRLAPSPSLFGFLLSLCALGLSACAGPRMVLLDDQEYPPRPSIYPIEVFDGKVIEAHREIAVIESTGYPDDTDETLLRQLEEMKRKVRKLGGDAIQDIRLLNKEISGFTIDERTPFPSWKQGEYPLYFLRGTAIIYEAGLPGAVSEGSVFSFINEGFDLDQGLE